MFAALLGEAAARKEMEKPADKKTDREQLEESGFSSLILSIASAALLNLEPEAAGAAAGGSQEDGAGARIAAAAGLKADLKMARHNIDLLGLLREKTRGNLTEKESQLLDACEKDLQLKYVMTQSKGRPAESPPQSKERLAQSKNKPAEKARS